MSTFELSTPDADGIIVLSMWNEDGSPNVIDKEFIKGFNTSARKAIELAHEIETGRPAILEKYGVREGARPAIIITGHAYFPGFVAGANLHDILKVETTEEIWSFCSDAAGAFSQLQETHITTIAAIDGPCLGGGLELALWCDYRIAADEPRVSIGLPEVNLGLIPALGGASLVARLLPFPKALDVVCGGKRYSAKEALSIGLIDRVASPDNLLNAAKRVVQNWQHSAPKRRRSKTFLDSKLGSRIAATVAKKRIRKKTGGHYPAPEAAVDVMRKGLHGSLRSALALEKQAVSDLLIGQKAVAKRLIRLFLDTESRKKTYPNRPSTLEPTECRLPECVGIVGAGLMGLGIAQLAAYKGFDVRLVDVNQSTIDSVADRVKNLTLPLLKKGKVTLDEFNKICARVEASTESTILRGCDFIIEAVIEDMNIKHKVLDQIETVRDFQNEVVATNTSSLSVRDFSDGGAMPQDVIGMHFFSPVHRMPLVEIIPHRPGEQIGTSAEAIEKTFRFAVALGKVPILCGDSTGFIVNRLLGAYLNEAAWCVIEGQSPDRIDKAMRDWGMPMGPCELMDEVGIFVASEVAQTLERRWPADFKVPTLLKELLDKQFSGKRGPKQAGFYEYKGDKKKVNPALKEIAKLLREWYDRSGTSEAIEDRLIKAMRVQATKLLDEKVAHSAADIDLALILGTGYPPFRDPIV